ncbi:MAG: tetratricopeptide repeat protein [Candidatus Omnitrophota bacterium]
MRKGIAFLLLCFMLTAHAARADDIDDLVNKNLMMRQQVDALETKCSTMENERDVLIARVKELQRQNDLLARGEAAKGISVTPAELADLKKKLDDASKKLSSAMKDRDAIQRDLDKAQKKLADMDKTIASEVEKRMKSMGGSLTASDKSDALRALQKENSSLKDEIQRLKDAAGKPKQGIVQPPAGQKSDIKPVIIRQPQADAGDITQAEILKVQLDKLESDLKNAKKNADDAQKDKQAAAAQAKKMKIKTDKERLDMHFNLAVVYEKNGMYADAEREYYKCLSIDPNDPEVHYNLAILYDDRMNKTSAALVHYRRYLELRPKGESSEEVRQWIFNAEQEARLGVEAR